MAAGPIRRPTRGSRLPLWAKSARPDPSVGHSGSVVGPVFSGTGTPASRPCLRQEATRHAPSGQGLTALFFYLMGERRRLGKLSACLLRPVSCLGTRHGVLLLLCLTTAHTFVSGVPAAGKFSISSISQPALRKPTVAGQPPRLRSECGKVQAVYSYKHTVATRVILPSTAS